MQRSLAVAMMTLAALVLLGGCAPGRVAEHEAGTSAAADRGIRDVIADQRLRGRIQGFVLNDDALLDEGNVTVTVFNRIVLLTGEVPDREAGARLAAFAREQEQARIVYNELVVADLSSIMSRSQDRMINTAAASRLMTLSGLPDGFDRDRVHLVTERQRLYLLGRVTREEADVISEALRRLRGVREVVRMFEYAD